MFVAIVSLALAAVQDRPPNAVVRFFESDGSIAFKVSKLEQTQFELRPISWSQPHRIAGTEAVRGLVRSFTDMRGHYALLWCQPGQYFTAELVLVDLRARRMIKRFTDGWNYARLWDSHARLFLGQVYEGSRSFGLIVDCTSGKMRQVEPFQYAVEDPSSGAVLLLRKLADRREWRSEWVGTPSKQALDAAASLIQHISTEDVAPREILLDPTEPTTWISFAESFADTFAGWLVLRSTTDHAASLYLREGRGSWFDLLPYRTHSSVWFTGSGEHRVNAPLAYTTMITSWNYRTNEVRSWHLRFLEREGEYTPADFIRNELANFIRRE